MAPSPFEEFLAYCRQLQQQHVELEAFVHGPSGRIVSGTRTTLKYPLLWAETPALQLSEKEGEGLTALNQPAILVLWNASSQDPAEQDRMWAKTQSILLDLLTRMARDRKQRLISFRITSPLEAVSTLTVANEYGWRVELDWGRPQPLCYDATRWQNQ